MITTKTKTRFPVSLNEVKQHLRVDITNTEDDDYINNFVIKSATRKAENFLNKDLAYTTNVYKEYDFCSDYLKIDEGNLISITDVSLNGTSYTSSQYELQKFDDHFTLEFDSAIGNDDNTLQVNFITGFDPDDCPEDIKQAIMILCGELYDMDRSGYVSNSVRRTDVFERLLLPYKVIRW